MRTTRRASLGLWVFVLVLAGSLGYMISAFADFSTEQQRRWEVRDAELYKQFQDPCLDYEQETHHPCPDR